MAITDDTVDTHSRNMHENIWVFIDNYIEAASNDCRIFYNEFLSKFEAWYDTQQGYTIQGYNTLYVKSIIEEFNMVGYMTITDEGYFWLGNKWRDPSDIQD